MKAKTNYEFVTRDPNSSVAFRCDAKPRFGKLKALALFAANSAALFLVLAALIMILPQAGGIISMLSIPAGVIIGLLTFMQASDRGWL